MEALPSSRDPTSGVFPRKRMTQRNVSAEAHDPAESFHSKRMTAECFRGNKLRLWNGSGYWFGSLWQGPRRRSSPIWRHPKSAR